MEIHVLIGKRKCSDHGQYALDTIACISDDELIANPYYLHDTRQEYLIYGDHDAIEVFTFTVDKGEIEKRLYPLRDSITATCV